MGEIPEAPIPPVPDRPMQPPEIVGVWREDDESDESFARRVEATARNLDGEVHWSPPKTFTTQRVPYLVHNALQRVIREIGMSLEVKGGFHTHMAVMIHPDDWRAFLEFMRQQGTLDESKGPVNVGSLELSGMTILQDLGAKVPHLELVAE